MTPVIPRPSRDRLVRTVFADKPIRAAEAAPPPAPPLTLALRRSPFPFAAALAISNDTRTMSLAGFREVYGAFFERKLEVGVTLSFGQDEVCAVGSRQATAFHEAGLADSVAGLPDGGAGAGLAALVAAGLAPACYVGNPSLDRALALGDAGVRYFTDASFVVGAKFGDGLDLRSTARLVEAFGRFSYDELGDPEDEGGTDLDALFEAKSAAERRSFAVELFNAPLIGIKTGHGLIRTFKRYRGPQRPAASTLPEQLRSMFLDGLELAGGLVIVEQRLGETALLGQSPTSERRRLFASDLLTVHELVALDDLAERSAERLLVALPSRLLDWVELRRCLQFEVDETDELWLIRLTGWAGSDEPLSRAMLDGLAFTLPATAPRTLVLIEGEERELSMTRAPEPKLAGHDCLYLPWERRSCPTF